MSITQLINKFEKYFNHYKSENYNEAQLRTDFLDPLFKLLGWDISNSKGAKTRERQVLVEEPLRDNSTTKKPDYTFRLFSERKFFVEAKKPFIDICNSTAAAHQVRRYGYTAKLSISVLSNFEYLIIYDCSYPVVHNQNTNFARIRIFHYKEFEKKLDEILSLIGYDSVYSGEFDKHWKYIETNVERVSVDALFLNQLERWRLILGKEFFKINNQISDIDLNDLVQKYLNCIIFLRVCEDRNLEEYKSLYSLTEASSIKNLILLFKKADIKYNSGLFKLKHTDKIIRNCKSVFWDIIKELYYPNSTYSFSVFPSDLLGNIYEMLLGKTLTINNNEVIMTKKLEFVDRDIVTTPTYIIKIILSNTLEKFCKNKTDKEILSSKFSDIACGSGAFLIEAYQVISDILIDYYQENNRKLLIQLSHNTFILPFEIKIQILLTLFGNDIDYTAIQAAKLGLYLKILENEDNDSIPTPALPSLDKNIIYGNSLVDFSMINSKDSDSTDIINPFDFEINFDVIFGNPPYLSTEYIKKLYPGEYKIYKDNYESAYKQFDKYYLFIEKAISLLKQDGYLGYIVPNKFFNVGAATKLRKLLIEKKLLSKIISFGATQIFSDKSTYTCLLFLNKCNNLSLDFSEISDPNSLIFNKKIDYSNIAYKELENSGWVLVGKDLKLIYDKIICSSIELGEIATDGNIYNGIQTSANRVFIHRVLTVDNYFIEFNYKGNKWKIEKELTRPYFKTERGRYCLNTYRLLKPNSFVIYPYILKNKKINFITIETMEQEYPYLYKFLLFNKEILANPNRDIRPIPDTSNEWYRYGRHQCLENCDVPEKIVVGVLSQGKKYAIDKNHTFISSGGTAGYCMITIPHDSHYSIYYIQALLNSKYVEWCAALNGEVFRGGFIARGTKVLKKLPIRKIDFSNPKELQFHKMIAVKQKRLIQLHELIDHCTNDRAREKQIRQFTTIEKQLEKNIKVLYGLSDIEDRKIPLISEIYAIKNKNIR